ncbi:MAG: helix-turn-helix domain-containing protein [Polyangiaceae bacterium]
MSSACDSVEIALVQSGAPRRETAGGNIFVPRNHLLVIPRDGDDTTTVMTSKHGVALWLSDDLVDRIAEMLETDPSARRIEASFLIKNRRIEALLQFLVDEVRDAGGAYTEVAETICESVVIELLDSTLHVGRPTALRDPRICSSVRRMQAADCDKLSVEYLANRVKMGRFEFSRLFRDDVGEAPYPFLLRVRIAGAVKLLISGSSIREAAIACGFSDLARFEERFKLLTGRHPSDLLREARSA